jgi:hypothetical protein
MDKDISVSVAERPTLREIKTYIDNLKLSTKDIKILVNEIKDLMNDPNYEEEEEEEIEEVSNKDLRNLIEEKIEVKQTKDGFFYLN